MSGAENSSLHDLSGLRRWPDVEAPNLVATDAADALVLETAAPALEVADPGTVVVIGDSYGALTLGAIARGAAGVRTHQDGIVGEHALDANARRVDAPSAFRHVDLGADLLADARVVVMRLPKSLDALDEIVQAIASYAAEDATIFAGGMVKHMTLGMNDVLARGYGSVTAGLATRKARVLTISDRLPGYDGRPWPRSTFHADIGIWIAAHGGAFAGTRLDIGTRALLEVLSEAVAIEDATSPVGTVVDLGCGTGVLATSIARLRPDAVVIGTDQSAAAVASARETARLNDVADRVDVRREDAAASVPDASVDLVLLNPPFHLGATVHADAGLRMIDAAARILAPGGRVITVFNSHLRYQGALRSAVGATRQLSRTDKFTVTESRRE